MPGANKCLFMENTEIEASKTISQVTAVLVASKARSISMNYDAAGKITGLQFGYEVAGRIVYFSLPSRVEPVFKILNGRRKSSYDQISNKTKDMEQAERVAWRQLLRWVEAQMAMVDAGMAKTAEVFMPYITNGTGRTMFEEFEEHGLKMLAAPAAGIPPDRKNPAKDLPFDTLDHA